MANTPVLAGSQIRGLAVAVADRRSLFFLVVLVLGGLLFFLVVDAIWADALPS